MLAARAHEVLQADAVALRRRHATLASVSPPTQVQHCSIASSMAYLIPVIYRVSGTYYVIPKQSVSDFWCIFVLIWYLVLVCFCIVKMIEDCHRRFRDDEIVEELITLLETHVRITREHRLIIKNCFNLLLPGII